MTRSESEVVSKGSGVERFPSMERSSTVTQTALDAAEAEEVSTAAAGLLAGAGGAPRSHAAPSARSTSETARAGFQGVMRCVIVVCVESGLQLLHGRDTMGSSSRGSGGVKLEQR
jgi:hypothetical protein